MKNHLTTAIIAAAMLGFALQAATIDLASGGKTTYTIVAPEKPSGEEQEAYFNTFPSIELFFEWYNSARDEYEKNNPTIEIGDDTIDIGNFGK